MKRIPLLVAILLAIPTWSGAQGSRKDDIALGQQGRPVAGATVTVCTAAATGTPCAPLATIYTDATLTVPVPNPFLSDGLGNYHFYAAPGRYTVQISGAGITTYTMNDVILPSDPSSSSSGNNISAFSLNLGGNLTVGGTGTFTGNVTAPNLVLNPAPGDAVRYASPAGNDTNTGLSWGAAKLTVKAACEALPGGAAGTCGHGTIFFSDGTSAHPTGGCGFWLMSSQDPNYGSPPTCWERANGTLALIGTMTTAYGPNAHLGRARLVGGNGSDRNHPIIWLSGIQTPMYFANVEGFYPGRGFVVGECSDNTRTGTCVSAGFTFSNSSADLNAVAGNGPTWDITGASFWGNFIDCGGSGNNANALTDNKHAVFLLDGTGNTGVGLIRFSGYTNLASGGIILIPGVNGGGVYVDDVIEEGDFTDPTPPAVWIRPGGGGTGTAYIREAQIADAYAAAGVPAVQNDVSNIVVTTMSNIGSSINNVGPMISLGDYPQNYANIVTSPNRSDQSGFFGNLGNQWPWRIGAVQKDDSRRQGIGLARYLNQAFNSPASWIADTGSGVTITTGIADPLGGTGAGRIANSNGFQAGAGLLSTGSQGHLNVTYAVGDWMVCTAAVRVNSGNGNVQYAGTYTIRGAGFTFSAGTLGSSTTVNLSSFIADDKGWEYLTGLGKIGTIGTNPSDSTFDVFTDNAHTLDLYMPYCAHVPAGAMSDNEAYEYALSLIGTRRDLPNVPAVVAPPNIPIAADTFQVLNGGFAASVTGTLTANRAQAVPDKPGTFAMTSDLPLTGTTGSIGGGALVAGACASGTASVANSTTSMAVATSPSTYPGDGFFWHGYVSAAGTVTVKVCASVAGTPTASTYSVRVTQ
jgi:hypothetical protein